MLKIEKNAGEMVRNFYNQNPFPDFEIAKFNSIDDFLTSAGWFYRVVNLYLPEGIRIADLGCGTGQFSGLLASKNREVVGVDFSSASINKAQALKNKFNLQNLNFTQADLLSPCFKQNTFDYVFCCGVLHHTGNPYRGFVELVRITKPNGFIIIGLYNHFGRIALRFKKLIMRFPSPLRKLIKASMIKRQLSSDDSDPSKIESWYADQYQHPHESLHSIKEVLRWFDDNNIEYVNSFPPVELFKTIKNEKYDRFQADPFKSNRIGAWSRNNFCYFLKELKWIIDLSGYGGYFLVIGKKRGD